MAEYISREAAKLRIFEYGVRHRNNSSISSACENLERQMNSIPAADVRPVVHGHNTGNTRIFECSECGYGFSDIFLTNERDYPIDPNYCPNCGADMREES